MNDKLLNMIPQLQNLFCLNQWNINVVLTDKLENQNVGETYFVDNDYNATIYIVDNNDIDKMKETLIHEFIHIIKRNSQVIAIDNIIDEKIYSIWFREMEKEQQVLARGIKQLIEKGDNK